MQRIRPRSNRYWRVVGGSGHLCDYCGHMGNFLAIMEHRETGVRLCMAKCYFLPRLRKEIVALQRNIDAVKTVQSILEGAARLSN